jgi:hypothetical protein
MALSAADATDRVEQLIALTERLTERIAAELAAFEARRPQDAAAGQDETHKLANLYRHESMRVKADPSLLAGAPAELRRRLVRATETFDSVLARHSRALEAAKTITEGLVQTIAREVAAARAPAAGYGAGGRATNGDASAVTLNRKA